jgi:tetratricopeptide (TPR) repeat protein
MAIAQAFHECGAAPRALKWLERIPADAPQYNPSRASMARILLSLGQYDEVLGITAGYSLEGVTEPLAWAHVRALTLAQRYEAAIEFVDRFDAARSGSVNLLEAAASAAIASGDWSRGLTYVDRALGVSPDSRLVFRRAVILFHLERFDDCKRVLQAIDPADEFYLRGQVYLARIHQRLGAGVELIAACEAILGTDPTNAFALEILIAHHIEQRDYAKARPWFDRAHAADPARFPSQVFEFQVLERQGRLKKAAAPFRTVESVRDLSEDLKERVVNAHYLSRQYKYARALAHSVADDNRRRILLDKLALATGRTAEGAFRVDGLEAAVVKALKFYSEARFDECIDELDRLIGQTNRDLGVANFRDLARSRTRLSQGLFDRADPVPATPGALPVIQQLWVGSELSYIEKLSIRSFIACGHETHLYTYADAIDAPPGCVIRDARQILPESDIFAHSSKTRRSQGSLAGFADLFRWKLVHDRGGAWADCDIVCLEPIASTHIVSTELARVGPVMLPGITNCFFAAPPGEAAFARAFETARAADRHELLWGEIGIHKMAQLVAAHGWGDRLTAPSDICPIPSFRIIDAIEAAIDVEEILAITGCRAVHLYNEVMRVVGFDKNGRFKEHGLIGILEKRVSELERRKAQSGRGAT